VRGRTLTVRAIALFGAASAAVHQLRYAIGYGEGAQHALAAHPHGYLSLLLPGLVTAMLIGLTAALLRTARGGSADRLRRRVPLLALSLVCALVLAAVFATQETLEGSGAFAHGGWIGLALSMPIGMLVALALRGAEAAEVRALRITAHFEVIHVVRLRITWALPHARVAPSRLGARAPPQSCVV
jgi:hypothetical protein